MSSEDAELEALDRLRTSEFNMAVELVPNALKVFTELCPDEALRNRAEEMLVEMTTHPREAVREEASHYLWRVRQNRQQDG